MMRQKQPDKLLTNMFPLLTDGRHDGPHEVKGSGEVPPRSDGVHADPGHVRLLVVPQEVLQVPLAQVVPLGEALEPLRPPRLRLALLGLLQRREDGGSAEEVEDDEERQQQEARVVLVDRSRAAAAAAPACHSYQVAAWGTRGVETRDPQRKSPSPRAFILQVEEPARLGSSPQPGCLTRLWAEEVLKEEGR